MPDIVVVSDPCPGTRTAEPVIFTVAADLEGDLWTAETASGKQILCQRLRGHEVAGRTSFVTVVDLDGETSLTLVAPARAGVHDGIRQLEPSEQDAFVRLDTGYFDLEMCSGTAQGTGASKWGLRHLTCLQEGVDLLPSGNNAIGGFYGPFFTPENGLINPPEHTTVEIEIVEQGPVLHHYRMHGVVPDGLLPELRNKKFAIDWLFTYGTPFFRRTYNVDDFQTVINGRSVTNKITVGDEFEGGPGELIFDRFETYGGTRFRAGDPYAEELVRMVHETLSSPRTLTSTDKSDEFRRQLTGDMKSSHWDLYWRLFCFWEAVLSEDEIRERLERVRSTSHYLADLTDRMWTLTEGAVDVSAVRDATIFSGPAAKTAEYHSASKRAMVWWTSAPAGAFQIVQRRESGWVNWGTNGENECPELPVGVTIKTAYGTFADRWMHVADQLESAPVVTVREQKLPTSA
jgi:hypothetical protein